MTRKLSLTTAVAVTALSVGVPAAFGADRLPISQETVVAQPTPRMSPDTLERIQAATASNRSTLLGRSDSADGARAAGTSQGASTYLRYSDSVDGASVARKSEGAGSFTARYSDSADGATFAGGVDVPVVSATSSGSEIEWPQVGVGFGIGLLLALGLGLILRATHVRPFAH